MSELTIRKCTLDDVNIVGAFYDEVVKYLDDTNTNYPKWMYKEYPSTDSTKENILANSQYVAIQDGKICAGFVLNTNPGGAYEKGNWQINLNEGEYMVIHGLAVHHTLAGQGIGTQIINYCKQYAKNNGYKSLRIDVVPDNYPAINLYKKCGFVDAGEYDLERGLEHIPTFTLLEYVL